MPTVFPFCIEVETTPEAAPTPRNYSIGSPEPRRGSSLRRSLDFYADREHCRHLAVRTTLLPLPQQPTIINPHLIPRLVQADSPLLDHTINLVLSHSLPPHTASCKADHPPPGRVTNRVNPDRKPFRYCGI